MNAPHYFFAIFGEPAPPKKDRIESGVYHPDPRRAPFGAKPGDLVLLYGTNTYDDQDARVQGVGVVAGTDDQRVEYRYFPLSRPIPMHTVEQGFEPADAEKFQNRRFATFWFFEISRESFVRIVGDRTLSWP